MKIELIFLGTGTSAGVPMIGCKCAVCTSSDPHDRRNRPSVVISNSRTTVLVDTSPELRLQAINNHVERIDAVVFTHAHADHIMGLDDVRRFNTVKGGPLDVWADEKTHASLQRCFGYAFKAPDPNGGTYRPHLVPRTITGSFAISDMHFIPIRLMHGNEPILGFRVGSLAYCTDVSAIPEESFELLKGLDVLVLDALQHKPHSTHFNLPQALEAAGRIGATRTYFTHIAHGLSHEETNRSLPENVRLAYDGLRVSTD